MNKNAIEVMNDLIKDGMLISYDLDPRWLEEQNIVINSRGMLQDADEWVHEQEVLEAAYARLRRYIQH